MLRLRGLWLSSLAVSSLAIVVGCGGGDDGALVDDDGGLEAGDETGVDGSTDGTTTDTGPTTDTGSAPTDTGSAPTDTGPPPPPPPGCPAAPAGISAAALDAYAAVNAARTGAGSPCAAVNAALDLGAEKHCEYYVANKKTASCIANPHVEVSTCASFYAANFNEREKKAGYTGSPSSEDMHFLGNAKAAVQGWIDTVYHRYPILDPWTREFGYGGTAGCDTMDFGAGASTPKTVVAVYPYDGQTNVPTSFNGAESPAPPAPPTGWPSGYVLGVHYTGTLSVYTITKAGTTTPIPVLTVPKLSYQSNATFFYTHKPLEKGTKYLMHAEGNNGAAWTKDWSFTTL